MGPDHPDTLLSRTYLASTLHRSGRFDEAEAEGRATLEVTAALLGPDHPDALRVRGVFALALQGLGRLSEAEAESGAVRETSERVLGAGHLDTLASRRNLDALIDYRGRSR